MTTPAASPGSQPRLTLRQRNATGATAEALEIGYFSPAMTSGKSLETGEVGYVATGLKDVAACRVGDTMTIGGPSNVDPLPGYEPMKPMVYTGL